VAGPNLGHSLTERGEVSSWDVVRQSDWDVSGLGLGVQARKQNLQGACRKP
jgi:hypothetical protein